MDAFIRKYQSFIVSLCFLVVGVTALVYSAVINPLKVQQDSIRVLASKLSEENQSLARVEQEMKARAAKAAQSDDGIQSLPDFLRRINAISNQTNVIIRELTPSRDGNIKFNIKITTDFYTFLRFIMRLESLNVAINDMQIRPYDPTKKPPQQAIEFSITPRHDAEPLESERIRTLRVAVEAPDRRNPFQRFAFDPTKQVAMEVDLTWIYRLSGIGRSGDEMVATIDNKDFRKGDRLENMDVSAIRSDRVELTRKTDHGTDRYILKFRSTGIKKP